MMDIKIKKFKIIEVNENKFGEYIFSNSINIVSGNNKLGKSTFIKSLMYSLGFEIKKWADKFEKNEFIYHVTLSIDNIEYNIIRFRDSWIIDNILYNLKEYRKFLIDKLKINTRLIANGKNIKHIPYPTDLFLFNYVDQDGSYHDLFKGNHNNWGMYKQNEIYKLYKEFIGISNEEIEELEDQKLKLSEEKKLLDSEQKTLQVMLNKLLDSNELEIMSLKFEEYKKEMERIEKLTNNFLNERNELEQKRYKTLNKLKELDLERIQLEEIYKELEKNTAEIHCKFCHSLLNQGFVERYQRELSKNTILLQYASIKNEIKKQEENLTKIINNIKNSEENLLKIQKLFNQTKKDLKFSEIIENNIKFGIKKELQENFDKNKILLCDKIDAIKSLNSEITKKKKASKNREIEIINFYKKTLEKLQNAFPEIDLSNLENKFMKFESKKTGADSNINTVITYYIYFLILVEFSKIKFPIIWDTFIKEVFDKYNSEYIEEIVNEIILKLNTQVICSNVPTGDKDVKIRNKFNYYIIELNEKLCYQNFGVEEEKLISEIYSMLQE